MRQNIAKHIMLRYMMNYFDTKWYNMIQNESKWYKNIQNAYPAAPFQFNPIHSWKWFQITLPNKRHPPGQFTLCIRVGIVIKLRRMGKALVEPAWITAFLVVSLEGILGVVPCPSGKHQSRLIATCTALGKPQKQHGMMCCNCTQLKPLLKGAEANKQHPTSD